MSVVIPVYNGEGFLAEAIESVTAQDYEPVETIVVDDGSTDRSADIATECGAVLVRQQHQGLAAARNAGVRRATGEFLAFLDADDLLCPSTLSIQVGHLLTHRDVNVVLGRQEIILEPGAERPAWLVPDKRGDLGGVPNMSLVVARSFFDEVGDFDKQLPWAEDTDWLMRARAIGARIVVLDDIVLRRRVTGANLSSSEPAVATKLLQLVRRKLARERPK